MRKRKTLKLPQKRKTLRQLMPQLTVWLHQANREARNKRFLERTALLGHNWREVAICKPGVYCDYIPDGWIGYTVWIGG